MPEEQVCGRRRVVIEQVRPEVDCGRFPIKRVAGDRVVVEAKVFADGHDQIACQVLHWRDGEKPQSSAMQPLGNDLWRGDFTVVALGWHFYTIEGWVDPFQTWRSDLVKRLEAGQDVHVDMLIGAALIEAAAKRAGSADAERLRRWLPKFRQASEKEIQQSVALNEDLFRLMQRYPDRQLVSRYERELLVAVDREKARFSAWYEVFPRSCSAQPGRHGTFRDCEAMLPYISAMGFDVVYLPPVHPIGATFRKGKNNSVLAGKDDVGSPWAIGAAEGGHTAIHPKLGNLEDFKHFVAKSEEHGLEVALDIAFQCSPDHPYAQQHKEWFRMRPDGTIQYAENPPKRYQDIYPLDFESSEWRSLWTELKGIFDFWIEQGIRIFRVDNPHTKPLVFWEWLIGEIKAQNPDVLFLAEAFTRPALMYRLSKLGFSQSYSYFAWRNGKQEIIDYFRELTATDLREYFRPSLWPNTPDILTAYLQSGRRPAFMVRFILAATLGSSYGIYGPAFELCEHLPYQPGSEEYLNSEKYELKHWDLNSPLSLKDLIRRVNRIRKESAAMQRFENLRFHGTDNPSLICYSKATEDLSDIILVIVNLDATFTQSGWTDLHLGVLGLEPNRTFQVHDLLGEGLYSWRGPRNFVELRPGTLPAHIFRVHR